MKFPRDFQVSVVYVDRELIELKRLTVFLRGQRFQVDEEYRTCQNGVIGHLVSHWIEYSARSSMLWVDRRQTGSYISVSPAKVVSS